MLRSGLLQGASVSVAVGKLVIGWVWSHDTKASQEIAKLTNIKAMTLPFYGCVFFYPSNECMSTECPVTSLL